MEKETTKDNNATGNLHKPLVISSKTRDEILKMIQSLDDRGHFYIFNNREDLVEGRTDWDSLKDTAENMFSVIENIKDLLQKS